MNRYSIFFEQNNHKVTLHENIIDILFQHKEEIYIKFNDLLGIFLIDYIAIKIIDPNNELVIFSITPSVEYNLLVQGLWKYDHSFTMNFQKNNVFYVWEKAYYETYFNEIKSIKEFKHGFTFGFNISKQIDSFHFTYSYATRSKNSKLYHYYHSHVNELSALGDYSYKLIRSIYAKYCNPNFTLPSISCKQNDPPKFPLLKLMVNNKR